MIVSEIKVSGIEDVEKRLGNMKKNAPTVVSRAINRAIQNVKKNMGKETSERYFITSGEVKKTVNVTKATKSRLQAAAISQGAGIALSKFKVNPTKKHFLIALDILLGTDNCCYCCRRHQARDTILRKAAPVQNH